MTKLIEYIAMAKLCEYKKPQIEYNSWTECDFMYDSLYITLSNPTQLQALLIMCNKNSFASTYFKKMAKEYIAKFKT